MEGNAKLPLPIAADVWPGLSRLWARGDVGGLVSALGFAIVLELVALSYTWSEWLSPSVQTLLNGLAVVAWIGGCWDARRFRKRWWQVHAHDEQLDLFLSARREYLRGEDELAERHLHALLAAKPEDVEARLLQATLYRRQGRRAEAKEQLRRLQRWREAGRWNLEIRHEWELLQRTETPTTSVANSQRQWGFRSTTKRGHREMSREPADQSSSGEWSRTTQNAADLTTWSDTTDGGQRQAG